MAPDGTFDLVPLHFLAIHRDDLARIDQAIAGLEDDPFVRLVANDLAGGSDGGVRLAEGAKRLAALLSMPWELPLDEDLLGLLRPFWLEVPTMGAVAGSC